MHRFQLERLNSGTLLQGQINSPVALETKAPLSLLLAVVLRGYVVSFQISWLSRHPLQTYLTSDTGHLYTEHEGGQDHACLTGKLLEADLV